MNAARRSLVLVLLGAALAGASGSALAQRRQNMDPQERQRLREDLNAARRDVYRGQGQGQQRAQPPNRGQGARMSPQEREQLRRDVIDADRSMRRKR